ncbi:MAG: hypothetical protein AAFZ15_02410 [Bacteroidota bacterium]
MHTKKTTPLTDLIAHLATDLVDIQKALDAQFEKDIQQFEMLLSQTPATTRSYLLPLAPRRQRANKHEVEARIHWQQEKSSSGGLTIGTQLLNFSADVRYQRNTENDCRLKIEIVQIPVNG